MEENFCFSCVVNPNEAIVTREERTFKHLVGMFAEIRFFGIHDKIMRVRGRISGFGWPMIAISPYEFGEEGNEAMRYNCTMPINLKCKIVFSVVISVFR